MTYQPNYTLPSEWIEAINEGGLDALPELLRVRLPRYRPPPSPFQSLCRD